MSNDDDLDDILSSALEDLSTNDDIHSSSASKQSTTNEANNESLTMAAAEAAAVQTKGQEQAAASISNTLASSASAGSGNLENDMMEFFKALENPDFMKTLESTFQALGKGDGDLSSLLGAAGVGNTAAGGVDNDLGIDQAEFMKAMEALKSGGGAEEEAMLKLLLQGMNAGGNGDTLNDENLPATLNNLMKNMLSKEIMGPSIKQVSTQYPKWLEKNRSKLTKDQTIQYEKQIVLFGHINKFYEENDENFDRLMMLMNDLQALGTPPESFLKELGPEFTGLPGAGPGAAGGAPPNCPTQ